MSQRGIGGHHRAYRGKTDSWITPQEVLMHLGRFDLDPCAAPRQPWPCAITSYTEETDGLKQAWPAGCRVFCNPPYGPQTGEWLRRMAEHGNGIALVFARTDTLFFHAQIFERAHALLFLKGRLTFCREDGSRAAHNSGGPSVLVAYGKYNTEALSRAWENGLDGKFLRLIGDH